MDSVSPPANYFNDSWGSWESDETEDYCGAPEPERKEQPLFSAEAQIYQLDTKTRDRTWTEMSSQLVFIHFYNDIVRRTYRILCVDGSKPLINCSLTPSIVVTKTSGKFAQWLDPRTKTLYGFGFQHEMDADTFINKFKELQSKIAGTRGNQSVPQFTECDSSDLSLDTSGGSGVVTEGQILRSEIERLKAALVDSSATAKAWDVELQKVNKQNMELKSAVEALTLMLKGNRYPVAQGGDLGAIAAFVGDSTVPADLGATASLRHHPVPMTVGGPRQRLTEDLVGMGGPSSMADQLQNMLDENRALQRRLHACETCQGQNSENRQLALQVQKAIGDKLTEALALHKVLSRLM